MQRLDLQRETPIPLAEAPMYLPKRNGKKAHYSTIYRWATKGARGRVLESTLVGGIRYTTLEALRRFLNGAPASSDDQLDAVCRALDDAGL
jgi:hypothetical protein